MISESPIYEKNRYLKIPSRKQILSTLSSFHDPTSILAGPLLLLKILSQRCAVWKLSWEEKLETVGLKLWEEGVQCLLNYQSIRWDRYFGPKENIISVITFADASKYCYCSISYVLVQARSERKLYPILAKSRELPLSI